MTKSDARLTAAQKDTLIRMAMRGGTIRRWHLGVRVPTLEALVHKELVEAVFEETEHGWDETHYKLAPDGQALVDADPSIKAEVTARQERDRQRYLEALANFATRHALLPWPTWMTPEQRHEMVRMLTDHSLGEKHQRPVLVTDDMIENFWDSRVL